MTNSPHAFRLSVTLHRLLVFSGLACGLQLLIADVAPGQEAATTEQVDSTGRRVAVWWRDERRNARLSAESLDKPLARDQWSGSEDQRRQMWLEMLGLNPLPERTPLNAVVTGTLDRQDYVVEKIHFQSLPGAYVIGKLYRPAKIEGPLPAVLYLCGHSKGKVNPPYQANPRWFAQHGYVAFSASDRSNRPVAGVPPWNLSWRAVGLAQPRLYPRGHRSLERDASTGLLGNPR